MICGIDEAGRGPLAGPVCAAAVVLPDDFPVDLLNDSKKLKSQRREEVRSIIVDKAAAWAVAWADHTEIDAVNILQASLLAMRRAVEQLFPKEITRRRIEPRTKGSTVRDAKESESFANGAPFSVPPCLCERYLENNAGIWPDKLETEAPFGRPFAAAPAGLTAIADGLYAPVLPIPVTPLVKADAKVHEVMAASILAKTARDQLMVHYGSLYPQYGYERHKGYPTTEHRKLVLQYGPSPIQRKSFRVEV